ncbi:MAG: chromate transporter [Candidatus Binataceae bacterium]
MRGYRGHSNRGSRRFRHCAEADRALVPAIRHDRLWRSGGPYRDYGREVRSTARLGFPRGFSRHARGLQPAIRRSKIAGAFLDGVNVGAVALMTAVSWQPSRAALVDFPTGAIAALSAVVLIYFRINSAWLIFAGGLAGLVATRWLGA